MTTDLTKITTPFGLLDDKTQKELMLYSGPIEYFVGDGWSKTENPTWSKTGTYRVKPVPPKPREWWATLNHKGEIFAIANDRGDVERTTAIICGGTARTIRVREVLE